MQFSKDLQIIIFQHQNKIKIKIKIKLNPLRLKIYTNGDFKHKSSNLISWIS